MNLPRRRLAVLLLAPVFALAACGGGSSSTKTSTSVPAPGVKTKVGVSVTGSFGQKPTLTVPTGTAPKALSAEVLSPGNGAVVKSGETLVANYLGQTWDPQNGQPNVFDNSYDRKSPAGFQIGAGQVIPGWDKTLVGQKIGSRLLLAIPPADAYGATPNSSNQLAGHTLLFVVDIVDALEPNLSASGAPVSLPAGMPQITSASGTKPVITSVKGIKTVTTPTSALLIKGTGEPIDATKTLALEIVKTDAATGQQTQQTWGKNLELVSAAQVLTVADALKGQKVGSRVVALTPAVSGNGSSTQSSPAAVLVLDVVKQY